MSQKRVPFLYWQLSIPELWESSALRNLLESKTGTRVCPQGKRRESPKIPKRDFHLHPHAPYFPAPDGRAWAAHRQKRNPKPHRLEFGLSPGCARHFTASVLKGKILTKPVEWLSPLPLFKSRWLERGSFWGRHNADSLHPPAQKILPSQWTPPTNCQRHGHSWALRRRWGQCPWDQNSDHTSRKDMWVLLWFALSR